MTGTDQIELRDVLRRHAERLRAAGVPSPIVDARLLAAHVLGDEPLWPGAPPPGRRELARLEALVAQRARRIPLQHLVGGAWFRHVHLACRSGVFIPRPETEVVAGLAIAAARSYRDPIVVEPCTGSGAVAVSLVAEVAGVRVTATDLSRAAVELATGNLERLERGEAGVKGPADRARWCVVEGDLFEPVDATLRGRVDVVVCNPPYMPARDRSGWEPEVADHDPATATVGGADGHEVVRRLLDQARGWLRPGGTLVVEIDERRGDETADHARRLGYVEVSVERDLTGADRAVVARSPEESSPEGTL